MGIDRGHQPEPVINGRPVGRAPPPDVPGGANSGVTNSRSGPVWPLPGDVGSREAIELESELHVVPSTRVVASGDRVAEASP